MAVSQLQQLIEGSDLSAQDKDMWLRALEHMDDEDAEAVLAAVRGDEHELDLLTRNLKLKQIAVKSGDRTLLRQVQQEEEEYATTP